MSVPELQEHSASARIKQPDDALTNAYGFELEKHRIAAKLELARLKQNERSARRCERRRDTALLVSILLTLVAVIILPGPVCILLALGCLKASVTLQQQVER
nr:hypothetical protein [uncultured Sphingomonas sp.]